MTSSVDAVRHLGSQSCSLAISRNNAALSLFIRGSSTDAFVASKTTIGWMPLFRHAAKVQSMQRPTDAPDTSAIDVLLSCKNLECFGFLMADG